MLVSKLILIYIQSNSVPLAPVQNGKSLEKLKANRIMYVCK